MAAENPPLIYHGRDKGFIEAEVENESRAVDHRPNFPGADIVKLPPREIGVQNHPFVAALVFPDGNILYSTGDANIMGKVEEPEFSEEKTESKLAKAKQIVEDALKRVDPRNPEKYLKSESPKSSMSLVRNEGHGMIVAFNKNKKSA